MAVAFGGGGNGPEPTGAAILGIGPAPEHCARCGGGIAGCIGPAAARGMGFGDGGLVLHTSGDGGLVLSMAMASRAAPSVAFSALALAMAACSSVAFSALEMGAKPH